MSGELKIVYVSIPPGLSGQLSNDWAAWANLPHNGAPATPPDPNPILDIKHVDASSL